MSREVISLTPSEDFTLRRAQFKDSAVVYVRRLDVQSNTATPVTAYILNPLNTGLGARLNDIAQSYERYRLKWCRLKFAGGSTNTGGVIAFGFVDDPNSGIPSTVVGITELRCAGTNFIQSQSMPTEIMWKPIDPQKWYYVAPQTTTDRFSVTGLIVSGSTNTAQINIELDMCFVFEGATATTG